MKAYEKMAEQLIKLMEDSNLPIWQSNFNKQNQKNGISGRRYEGINKLALQLLCNLKGYKSDCWFTFNQIAKLGGNVKKGEKGTYIVYWMKLKKQSEDIDKEEIQVVEKPKLVPKLFVVFNYEQCENIQISEYTDIQDFDQDFCHDEINKILKEERIPKLRFDASTTPCYIPSMDLVIMPFSYQYNKIDNYYKTLFHELGHATGAVHRLNRPGVAVVDTKDIIKYSFEELIAEFTACYLCGHFNLSPDYDNSASYLKNWLAYLQGNKTELIKAAAIAQKAADYILG